MLIITFLYVCSVCAPTTLPLSHSVASGGSWNANFLPEFGRFMVEATPAKPYGGFSGDLRMVEANMRLRRKMISAVLQENERFALLTGFPLMGVGSFADTDAQIRGPIADSDYIVDDVIGAHPRFG